MEQKKQNQEQLHNIKLQLLGEMSAGIVHEITNPLSSITLNAESIESLLADYKEEKEYNPTAELDSERVLNITNSIVKEVDRIGQVLNSINQLSKPQESSTFSLSDLGRLVDESKHLCNYLLTKYNVNLTYQDKRDAKSNNWQVEVNYSFLIHALVNLIKNSCEALDRQNTKDRWIRIYSLISEGTLVVVVQDSGEKESEQDQKLYFDAGFTKKKNGTGLGLNFSRNLLETYGAKIESVPKSETTTMRIILKLKNE